MKTFFALILITFYSISQAQITVDNTQSAQDLVQLLFNGSGCATVSNFSVSGNNSYASFSRNGSSFPFEDGVVLSTGRTNHIPGPNTSLSDDNLGTPNDADLNVFFTDTFDTTVLEFDFVPLTSYISFEYIFASEEYQEGNSGTCNYSDVFAFLIKSNLDTNYTNIALVPNTTTPVQVTSVHPEIPGSCQAENEVYFGQWNSQSDPNIAINYNGQTAALKAESNVVAGLTYHIKLIIADHVNYRYDSAVFLKAGSFNVGTDLGIDRLRSTQNAICGTNNLLLDSGYPSAIQYKWFKDDVPYNNIFTQIAGANSQTYNVTSEGKYKVEVDLGGGCISEGKIIVEYESLPTVFDTELIGCNDDFSDFFIFDLPDANIDITNGDSSLQVVNFYHSAFNASNDIAPIMNFDNYTNQILNEELFARVTNQNGCISVAKVTLRVYHNPKIKPNEEVFYCLNTFPTPKTLESGLLIGNPLDFTYHWSYDDGSQQVDLFQNTTQINVMEAGIYTVEITSVDGCKVSRNITLTNSNIATIVNVTISETLFPDRISIKIDTIGEGDYEYAVDDYNFQNSPIFDHLLYGYHVITVKDKNGCIPNAQKAITILQYQKFFTPNNDGHYDYWNLNNSNALLLHYNTVSDITIFDRFGNIMAVISAKGQGWNGYYNGALALPEDYWFSVDLIDFNGKVTTKKGNFSLVR